MKHSCYNSKELEETLLGHIQLLYNVAQVGKSPNAVPNIEPINVIIVYYYIAQFKENVQKPNKQSLFSKYFCNGHFISIEFHHPFSSSHILLFNQLRLLK